MSVEIKVEEYKDFLDDFEKKNNNFFSSKNFGNSEIESKNRYKNNKKFSQDLKNILKNPKKFESDSENQSQDYLPIGKIFLIGDIEKEKINEFLQARKFVRNWIKSKHFRDRVFEILLKNGYDLENIKYIQQYFLNVFDEGILYVLPSRQKDFLDFLLEKNIFDPESYEIMKTCFGLTYQNKIFVDCESFKDTQILIIHEFAHLVDEILNELIYSLYDQDKISEKYYLGKNTNISKLVSKNYKIGKILKNLKPKSKHKNINFGYQLENAEIYAGVFELRKIFDLKPGEKITYFHLKQIINSKKLNKNIFHTIIFCLIMFYSDKDEKNLGKFLEKIGDLSDTNFDFLEYFDENNIKQFLDYINSLP